MELDGAELALAVAVAGVAVTWEAHGHGAVTGERNEAEAVGNELVVEDGGVDFDLDEVDGDGGDFGDHDAAEGVGDAGVGVSELELEVVVFELSDFDSGSACVWCSLHFWGFWSLCEETTKKKKKKTKKEEGRRKKETWKFKPHKSGFGLYI